MDAARQGAVFYWLRRMRLGKSGAEIKWYIRAFAHDGEQLYSHVKRFSPTEIKQVGGLWVCSFHDLHINSLLDHLFPLTYRRLHRPSKWPVSRGGFCQHPSTYVWGPLPNKGVSVVCLGCFKVTNVERLELGEIAQAMFRKRNPSWYTRTPVVNGITLHTEPKRTF
jgi:hypothetical protein